MRELPQKVPPGILAPVMKMHGLDSAQPKKPKAARKKTAATTEDAWKAMESGKITPTQFIRVLKNKIKRGQPIPREYDDILRDDLGIEPSSL